MEPEGDGNYKIEPKRGGIFQLWKLKDVQETNKEMLVILFGFYGATQKAISKYCDIYLKKGFLVLYIPSRLLHFAFPSHAIKLGKDLMDYLDHDASEFSFYFVHTFSMGSYNFAVCNYGVMGKQPEKYGHIKRKIKAIVYDSITVGSPERMMTGIGMGMARSKVLQALIPKLMSLYFFVMQNYTIKQFEEWLEMCRTVPLEVPTLSFFCENDPISDYEYIHEMIEGFRKMGTFPVLEKCWQKSRHAIHLMIHTDEYLEYIDRLFHLIPEIKTKTANNMRSKI